MSPPPAVTRGDLFRLAAHDRSRPIRPVVVRDEKPGRPSWLIVFAVRGVRHELRYRSHPSAVVRAHEVAELVAHGHRGPFYSRDEIRVGMGVMAGSAR